MEKVLFSTNFRLFDFANFGTPCVLDICGNDDHMYCLLLPDTTYEDDEAFEMSGLTIEEYEENLYDSSAQYCYISEVKDVMDFINSYYDGSDDEVHDLIEEIINTIF